jgi:hypothetical protein
MKRLVARAGHQAGRTTWRSILAHRAHKVLRGRRAFPCGHDLFDHLTMLGDPKDRNREEENLERTHYDDGVRTMCSLAPTAQPGCLTCSTDAAN